MDSVTTQIGASSSSSSFNHSCTYDVFLCYRGADTHNNFTDHLYSNLLQKGIKTFLADVLLRRGEELTLPMLYKIIEDSRISIIVFSENFASSGWCLDELVEILQCRESNQQIVWPVYYKVDPMDVRNQQGTFGEALANHENKFRDNMEKVLRWRAALTDATNLPGWYFLDGHNSKFIDNIVEEISAQVLNRTYLNVAKHPVGIESRVQDMNELLGVGVNDVRMVGIWGIHGIGKTTIAKAVYNSIAHEFEGSCFLENVRKNSMERGGLVQLQKTLLSEILGEEQLELTDVDEGINVIKKRLSRKRVLLILDCVNQMEQLKKLVGGSDWYGLGSRIIITSREKHVLTAHQVNLTYKVEELEFDEAFELFSWNAFPINKLPDDYAKVAAAIVHYAQGIPLALGVIGSHLCGRSIDQWRIALDGYRSVPNLEIQDILKISYDALEDSVKEVFLDIACFLNGRNKKYVIKMLESCHLNPEYGIEVLIEKAFIIIKKDHIWMNDLIEKLGKEIVVRQDSLTGHERRSRLWFYKNVNHVLLENKGINKTKGIVVKSHVPDEKYLSAKSFLKATSAERIFLLIALCLEILSLAFDQASSPSNPHYALFGMMLAIVAVLICILELIYKGKKERVELRRWRTLWWFYYPRPQRRLYGSLPDIYGLVGAISQCICSTVQYVCFIRHDQNPIKVSLWPAIFLICLGASRLNWIGMDETDEQNV